MCIRDRSVDRQRRHDVNTHQQGRCRLLRYPASALQYSQITDAEDIDPSLVSLVLTRVDYCNAVLTGVPLTQLTRLQVAINASSLLISGRRCHHITPLLVQLHWLRVSERIEYKLCVLVCRCLHDMAPEYLVSSFQRVSDVTTRRYLRSASTSQLIVPASRCSTLGDRAFPVAAARAWNAFPHTVSSAPSRPAFKRFLKTHLFYRSFYS